jgi:hypothetical protein
MHESTVSRITTNKYIDTPQGLYELKFFFHSGIKSYTGNSMSSIRVQNIIKDVVASEDERAPPYRRPNGSGPKGKKCENCPQNHHKIPQKTKHSLGWEKEKIILNHSRWA